MPLEKIRDVLKGSLGRSLQALRDEDKLAMAWPLVCGKAMAEHGVVLGYIEGVLHVQVADGPWRRQLISMQGQLAAEMSHIAGVKVSEIHWSSRGITTHERTGCSNNRRRTAGR